MSVRTYMVLVGLAIMAGATAHGLWAAYRESQRRRSRSTNVYLRR